MKVNRGTRLLRGGIALLAMTLVAAPWWSTTVVGQTSNSDAVTEWNDCQGDTPRYGGGQHPPQCENPRSGPQPPSCGKLRPPCGEQLPPRFGKLPPGGQQPPSCGKQRGGQQPPEFRTPPCGEQLPPRFGKLPGGGQQPPSCGKLQPPCGEQLPPRYGKPTPGDSLPPGLQWNEPRTENDSDIQYSWFGEIQVNGVTVRREFRKQGNVWSEIADGKVYYHQELMFTGDTAVLYDANRKIRVRLTHESATYEGPDWKLPPFPGGFRAVG